MILKYQNDIIMLVDYIGKEGKMNQILISEKVYITPELKRKKRMYKIDFFISVFLVFILSSYYIYAEYDKSKSEEKAQEILSSVKFNSTLVDDTTIKFEENSTLVLLNEEDNVKVVILDTSDDEDVVEDSEGVISNQPEEPEFTEEDLISENIRKTTRKFGAG